jgi:crotonobetainyl-CoA:carnitine CoA-transferase CaiB-like acyl-CoA transferase
MSASLKEATLPLAGIRVIEVTHAWAGPLCGMFLADMGAEVVKVEPTNQPTEARGGFPYVNGESVIFMMTHRNKKSITLDLKSERGKKIFFDLVRSADVLIQNMRPGSLKRMGMDFEGLKTINPRLVYTSVTGYGHKGAKENDAGVDQVAIAATGLAATTMNGSTGHPVALGTPICDFVAAMWACHGTLCALMAREKTGLGQTVDTSLFQAGLSMMIGPMAMQQFLPGYTGYLTGINGPSEFFLGSDGRYFSLFASYPALWERFEKVMNCEELSNDPRFKSRDLRTKNVEELHQALRDIFIRKPAKHWIGLLNGAGVPVSLVNTMQEALEEGQTAALDLVYDQKHPKAGDLRLLGVPVTLSDTPGTIRTPAPLLGEHTAQILAQLGVSQADLNELQKAGVVGSEAAQKQTNAA